MLYLAQIFVAFLFAKNNVVLQASRGAQRIKRTTLLTFKTKLKWKRKQIKVQKFKPS